MAIFFKIFGHLQHFCQYRIKNLQNTKYTPKNLPKIFKIVPKFRQILSHLSHPFQGKVFLHNCWSGVGHFFLTSVRRYAFMPLKSHLIFSTSSTPYSDHHFLGGDESKKQFLSRFNQDHKCSFKRIWIPSSVTRLGDLLDFGQQIICPNLPHS